MVPGTEQTRSREEILRRQDLGYLRADGFFFRPHEPLSVPHQGPSSPQRGSKPSTGSRSVDAKIDSVEHGGTIETPRVLDSGRTDHMTDSSLASTEHPRRGWPTSQLPARRRSARLYARRPPSRVLLPYKSQLEKPRDDEANDSNDSEAMLLKGVAAVEKRRAIPRVQQDRQTTPVVDPAKENGKESHGVNVTKGKGKEIHSEQHVRKTVGFVDDEAEKEIRDHGEPGFDHESAEIGVAKVVYGVKGMSRKRKAMIRVVVEK